MKSHCYFIATSWNDSGGSQHFRALSKEFVERGHRVVVLVDGQRQEVEDHKGNPSIYTWPSRRPVKLRDALFLRNLISAYRPDCLIANFGAGNVMMLVGWLMGIRCRLIWYRTLTAQNDLDAPYPRWKIQLLKVRKRKVYRTATHIIANSEAASEDVQRVFRVPESKCRVFYNSLADPLQQPAVARAATQRQKGLVCIGRLYPSKGQDVLIRAIALLKQTFPDIGVDFVGDGPFRAFCAQLAQTLGVKDSCMFVGSVRHDEVLIRMASAVATVVPSISEAFGLVNIESLAVGTPVVASRVGGITEIVRDGIDGFLVPPDSPALADKLRVLLANPDLAKAMSRNARDRFLAKFDQSRAVREQAQWFESIVASARQISG